MRLSIIVPVYNAEKFLDKCITSILQQTFQDFELVLVDDGSTDGSGEICDQYVQIDKRVRAFHIPNGGIVGARKYACEIAKGELLTFVDSDDWIECQMYQVMMAEYQKEKTDLITSGLIYDYGEKRDVETDTIVAKRYEKNDIYATIIPRMMYDCDSERRAINSSTCNKLFNAELFRKVIKGVDADLSIGEDAAIVYPFIAQADSITVLHDSWYHYVHRAGSMSQNYTMDSLVKVKALEDYLQRKFKELSILDKMNWQIKQYIHPFIERAINDIYGIRNNRISYIFPYELIEKGSRIAIYGAGNVGKDYWKSLNAGNYAKVVAWYDQKYEGMNDVKNPETICEDEFDCVIIAIMHEEVAMKIREWISKQGVAENKIIWQKPQKILDVV